MIIVIGELNWIQSQNWLSNVPNQESVIPEIEWSPPDPESKKHTTERKRRPILLSHIIGHPRWRNSFSVPMIDSRLTLWDIIKACEKFKKKKDENKDINGCKHSLFEFISRGVFCLAWKKFYRFCSERACENKIRVVMIIV